MVCGPTGYKELTLGDFSSIVPQTLDNNDNLNGSMNIPLGSLTTFRQGVVNGYDKTSPNTIKISERI